METPTPGESQDLPYSFASQASSCSQTCLWQRQVCMILPRDTVCSPGLCFLTGRSQAHSLLVHTQQGVWSSCFGLACTSASAQLRGCPGRAESSPRLMGLCSTRAATAWYGSQREEVSKEPDLFPKQGICSYTAKVKQANLLFFNL